MERLFEREGAPLLDGVDRDRYLFTCGALYALRRVHGLPDAILSLAEMKDARTHRDAKHRHDRRLERDTTFLNTPFWDAWVRDRALESTTNGTGMGSGTDG